MSWQDMTAGAIIIQRVCPGLRFSSRILIANGREVARISEREDLYDSSLAISKMKIVQVAQFFTQVRSFGLISILQRSSRRVRISGCEWITQESCKSRRKLVRWGSCQS